MSTRAKPAKARLILSVPEVRPESRFGPTSVPSDSGELPVTRVEPFVTAKEAAAFLRLSPRRILEMARSGQLPAHPLGNGKRHQWRFRLGELAQAVVGNNYDAKSGTISPGSPSGPGQEK